MRDFGQSRCVDISRWRDDAWLGVIQGAVCAAFMVGACGPSPVYTRYGLSEVGAGGTGVDTRDGGSEAATGGRRLPGTGGAGGAAAPGGGTGGAATGGAATGGAATGGAATGGAATGGASTGGAATGGAATGGAATGGAATGGAATGGAATGGAATGGAATGGAIGGRGTGGASALPEPCSGLCTNPVVVVVGTGYSSGGLGTGTSCFETKEPIAGGNCGNFVSPRAVRVNGVVEPCDTGGNWTSVPATRNGGHCIQVTAGEQTFAYLTLW